MFENNEFMELATINTNTMVTNDTIGKKIDAFQQQKQQKKEKLESLRSKNNYHNQDHKSTSLKSCIKPTGTTTTTSNVNFIERNKANISQRSSSLISKNSNNNNNNSTTTFAVIKYINDFDKKVTKNKISINDCQENVPPPPTFLNELCSNINTSPQTKDEEDECNQSPLQYDISIISDHSSIISEVHAKHSASSLKQVEIELTTTAAAAPEVTNKNDNNEKFFNNKVNNKDYVTLSSNEGLKSNDNYDSFVHRNVHPLSESNPHNRQYNSDGNSNIIPNYAPNYEQLNSSEFDQRQQLPSVSHSSSSLMQQHNFEDYFASSQKQWPILPPQYSMAAAMTMTSLTQPLMKKQDDLDNKVNNIITQLENLKKPSSIRNNNDMFEDNNWIKYNNNVNKSESFNRLSHNRSNNHFKHRMDNDIELESNLRMKYLEKLQENQFELMSKLINTIGTETKNAGSLAKSGRDSLEQIRQQLYVSSSNEKVKINNDERNRRRSELVGVDLDPSSPLKKKTKSKLTKNNFKKIKSYNQNKKSINNYRSTSNSPSNPSRSRSHGQQQQQHRRPRSLSKYNTKSNSPARSRSSCSSCNRQIKKVSKNNEFLHQLVDSSFNNSSKSPNNSFRSKSTSINNKHLKKSSNTDLFNDDIKEPTLFDKYLNEAKNSNRIFNNSNNNKTGEIINSVPKDPLQIVSETPRTSSMFEDIKEVLKAVELSKSQIDANSMYDNLTARDRKNQKFYTNLNITDINSIQNERMRMKHLVDGCVNAISNDVQKVVNQKLIDESRNVKLIAERDSSHRFPLGIQRTGFGTTTRSIRSSSTNTQNDNQKKPLTSDTNKYLGKVFGKSLLDQIKMENLKAKREEETRARQVMLETKKISSNINSTGQHQSRYNKTFLKGDIGDSKKHNPTKPAFSSEKIENNYDRLQLISSIERLHTSPIHHNQHNDSICHNRSKSPFKGDVYASKLVTSSSSLEIKSKKLTKKILPTVEIKPNDESNSNLPGYIEVNSSNNNNNKNSNDQSDHLLKQKSLLETNAYEW
jgi:hypothetical protein